MTLWIEWTDENELNSGSARWGDLTDEQLDQATEAVKGVLGEPDTLT